MLNDPLSVTIDGTSKSLARVTQGYTGNGAQDGSVYRDSTGEYSLSIEEYVLPKSEIFAGRVPRRVDITLHQKNLVDPVKTPVAVGMHYVYDENATPDFSKLQPALVAFLTDALRARVVAGEN